MSLGLSPLLISISLTVSKTSPSMTTTQQTIPFITPQQPNSINNRSPSFNNQLINSSRIILYYLVIDNNIYQIQYLMENGMNQFQRYLLQVTSQNQEERQNAELVLMNYRGEECTQEFINDVVQAAKRSANPTLAILALSLLKSRIQRDTFYSEQPFRTLTLALIRMHLEDTLPPSSQTLVLECLGLLSTRATQYVMECIYNATMLNPQSKELAKMLEVLREVVQTLNRTYLVGSRVNLLTQFYKLLMEKLIECYLSLDIHHLALATQCIQGMILKSVPVQFNTLYSYLNFATDASKSHPSQNNLIIRSFCGIFIKYFELFYPSNPKTFLSQYQSIFTYQVGNMQFIGDYESETLLSWINLFSKVLRCLVTNKNTHLFSPSSNLLNQDTLAQIFKIVVHCFQVAEDTNVELMTATSETIRIIKEYTDDTSITQYLTNVAKQFVVSSTEQNTKPAYLYLLSNLLDEIQVDSILAEVLKHLDNSPNESMTFACCYFLKSVLQSGQIDRNATISAIHSTLLKLLEHNRTNNLVRNEIYHVMSHYLHKSVEEETLNYLINQLFKIMCTVDSEEDVIWIIQSMLEKKDQSPLISKLIHARVRQHIESHLQQFMKSIHLVGALLNLLAETICDPESATLPIYQGLFSYLINSDAIVVKESLYKMMFRLLKISKQEISWITHTDSLSKMLMNVHEEYIPFQTVVPLLIECAVWKPQLVELFCLQLLQNQFSITKNIQFCALTLITSLIRKKQANQKLISLTLQQLRGSGQSQIILFCLQLVTLKQDPSLLKNEYHPNILTNVLRSGFTNAFRIINDYYVMKNKSDGGMEELEQAMSGLSVQEKQEINKNRLNRLSESRMSNIFYKYNFRIHSHRVQSLIE